MLEPSMLAPNHLVRFARWVALALLMLIAASAGLGTGFIAPILIYFLTVALMVGFPDIRSGDIAGVAVSFAALLCFVELAQHHSLGLERLAYIAAAIGAAILPIKASRIRRLANGERYRTFADRRNHARRADPPEASKALIVVEASSRAS